MKSWHFTKIGFVFSPSAPEALAGPANLENGFVFSRNASRSRRAIVPASPPGC
jgi:hypothetical protein